MVAADAFGGHVPVFEVLTSDEGRTWLATLASIVGQLEAEWDVRTGSPFAVVLRLEVAHALARLL